MHKYTYIGYAGYKPVFNDSCYTEASEIGALSWNPPQDSEVEVVNRYEVLYTPSVCSASTSDVTLKILHLTNETSITLPPSEVYCVQVSNMASKSCAQVTSLMQSMNCITFLVYLFHLSMIYMK